MLQINFVVCMYSSNYSKCAKIQDVAVKVLTSQDFHDDQLKEFLREVGIYST